MIGLIVDGEGDYAAFRARYRGQVRVYRADGPRGHKATEKDIVESARRQIIQLRQMGCTRIAIVTDFEARPGNAGAFRAACVAHARSLDYAADIMVFVADRMLENWLLADIAYLSAQKKYLRRTDKQRSYESTNGKVELKKFFEKGFDYNEVRHGQELFTLLRSMEAARFSASFSEFCEGLGLA